jgi:hypothetical protein
VLRGWTRTQGEEYSKIYESGWIKIPSANFEQEHASNGLKMLGYWAVGIKPGPNTQLYGWTKGVGGNPATAFQFMMGSYLHRDLWPNVDTRALLTCGKWHRYEIVMEINTIGQANGKFKMWWDGIQTHNYSNVTWRTASAPAKFFDRKLAPIWGGMGGPNKQRSDRVLFDHIYISGMK